MLKEKPQVYLHATEDFIAASSVVGCISVATALHQVAKRPFFDSEWVSNVANTAANRIEAVGNAVVRLIDSPNHGGERQE